VSSLRETTLVHVLYEQDFVPGLIVEQLIHYLPHHEQAEPAGAQALLLSHVHVFQRNSGRVAHRRVLEVRVQFTGG
jgi:hypothetical protein